MQESKEFTVSGHNFFVINISLFCSFAGLFSEAGTSQSYEGPFTGLSQQSQEAGWSGKYF